MKVLASDHSGSSRTFSGIIAKGKIDAIFQGIKNSMEAENLEFESCSKNGNRKDIIKKKKKETLFDTAMKLYTSKKVNQINCVNDQEGYYGFIISRKSKKSKKEIIKLKHPTQDDAWEDAIDWNNVSKGFNVDADDGSIEIKIAPGNGPFTFTLEFLKNTWKMAKEGGLERLLE